MSDMLKKISYFDFEELENNHKYYLELYKFFMDLKSAEFDYKLIVSERCYALYSIFNEIFKLDADLSLNEYGKIYSCNKNELFQTSCVDEFNDKKILIVDDLLFDEENIKEIYDFISNNICVANLTARVYMMPDIRYLSFLESDDEFTENIQITNPAVALWEEREYLVLVIEKFIKKFGIVYDNMNKDLEFCKILKKYAEIIRKMIFLEEVSLNVDEYLDFIKNELNLSEEQYLELKIFYNENKGELKEWNITPILEDKANWKIDGVKQCNQIVVKKMLKID